ncbi:MAG: hypothetical protein ACOYMN_24885 [Roseimicrobium sp.]
MNRLFITIITTTLLALPTWAATNAECRTASVAGFARGHFVRTGHASVHLDEFTYSFPTLKTRS